MELQKIYKKRITKLTFWDFGLLKITLIIFGMILGALWFDFVLEYVWWFVILFALGYIYLFYKIFSK